MLHQDRLQVVASTAIKAANDLRFFPYPLKEGWLAMAMAKKPDTYGPPGSQHHVNQRLKQTNKQTHAAFPFFSSCTAFLTSSIDLLLYST